MKKFTVILAVLCMVGLTLSSCKSDSSEPTDLSGTKWKGVSELTTITASFSDKQCTASLSGYAKGKVVGTYLSNGGDGEITVTSISGDAKYYVSKGQHISLEYNLTQRTLTARMYMHGTTYEIDFTRVD